jgi:hypothetical protein
MFTGVADIRELYRLTAARLEQWDTGWPLAQQASAFAQRQRAWETQLRQMQERCEAHLQESALHLAQQQVLSRLHNHGAGLTVCVERPEVALDNNTAERVLRHPGVGRQNSDGSGSVWSAHWAAMLLRVIHTVVLWGLNPPHGLHAFLQACADSGGQSPADRSSCVPWPMTAARREALARPVPVPWLPLASPAQRREASEAVDPSERRSA